MFNKAENSIWNKINPDYKVNDDFTGFQEKLYAYCDYLEEHDLSVDLDFYTEIDAMRASLGKHTHGDWLVCHMDDAFYHMQHNEPPKYSFMWDGGMITWSLPGDIKGSIDI